MEYSRSNTWTQQANKQAYENVVIGNLKSNTLITTYDPIYNKLVEQIGFTIYHKLRLMQKWQAIGTTSEPSMYPNMLREIAMAQRKGWNFPEDNGVRPSTLLNYDIINDDIDVRYHACQMRWMYGYTIFDEELRRFSGGNGATIGEITEMKTINAVNARNRFMDLLRKKVLNLYITNIAEPVITGIDISDYATLTQADAQQWLKTIDELLFILQVGTDLYNGRHEYMQTGKGSLQLVMRYKDYKNVVLKAFPDTYHDNYFKELLPANIILIDDFGAPELMRSGAAATPTFTDQGLNQLNWQTGDTIEDDDNLQCAIYDKSALGFEDNLNETLFGEKDIEKLATPVRMHYWTRAYCTDILNGIIVKKEAPTPA